jgi:hypothetical protein
LLSGAPGGDDAYYHAMYAQQEARCWLGGVPFPRWYPDLNGGLGAPEPRPRPLLPLALHAAFALMFDDAVAAISLATLIIPACAALVMLAAARKRGASLPAATVAAGMWAASPYLMVSLHERAALQEAWACVLLPWVFVTLLPPWPQTRRDVLRGSVAFALLLATQLLFAFMVGLTIAAAHLVARARHPLHAAASGALGLGLAAASWWPNVASLGRIQGERFASGWFDWRTRFLFAGGGADPALARDMLLVCLAVVALAALAALAGDGPSRWLAIGAIALAALATPLGYPAFRFLPGFALLQFPWRWLAPASCLALLSFARVGDRRLRLAGVALFLFPLVVPFAWRWRLPSGPPLRPSDPPAAAARAATRFGVPALLPSFPATLPRGVDLGRALRAAAGARAALPPAAQAGPRTWTWKVRRGVPGPVILPLLADDGWRSELDGRTVGWAPRDGLVQVMVPAGVHTVSAEQVLLPEDVAGMAASGAALLALVALASRRQDSSEDGRVVATAPQG